MAPWPPSGSATGSRVEFSVTADPMALFSVRTNPRWRLPPSWKNFKWPSLQPVVRFTSCLALGWGFLGRRMQWRYIQFEQIQDGGCRHLGKISNGHISATGRPIHSMSSGSYTRRLVGRYTRESAVFDDPTLLCPPPPSSANLREHWHKSYRPKLDSLGHISAASCIMCS